MYVEYKRSHNFKIKILFIFFLFFFIKEAFYTYYLYNFIPFQEVLKGSTDLKALGGDYLNNLFEVSKTGQWASLKGDWNRYIFIWNLMEVVFSVLVFHLIHFWINIKEKKRTRFISIFVNLLLIGGGLTALFGMDDAALNSSLQLFLWGFFLWRTVMLILSAFLVGKIYKYTLLDLRFIVTHKLSILSGILLFMFFYLINTLVMSNARPFPFFIQLLGILSLVIFSYKYLLFLMSGMEEKVLTFQNERSLVIKLLQDIGHAMAENLSQELVMERIVAAAIKATEARSGAVLLKDKFSDNLNVEYVHGFYPPVHKMELGNIIKEKFLVDKFKSSKIKIGENESYIGHVAATGESLYIPDCLRDERIEQTAPGLMEIRSVIAVPLKIQDEILGVMAILNKESAMFFTEADFSLMETLADQASITLNQVKLYQEMLEKKQDEKELNVAGNIQQGLLPQEFPDFPKIEISAFSHAAKGVGGDYYDLIDFGNGKVGVIITDVAGKGVPAALVMVMIRSVLRTYAKQDKEAMDVITTVNNTISGEVTEERYATMFYFVFDSEYKILNYCNAGHGPLLLYRSNLDSFALLDTEGMPVGIAEGVVYGQEYTSLHSGDIAVLYTDGITECMNVDRGQYGMERLKKCIRENKDLSAKELTDKIYKEIKDFAGNAPQHDDETLVLMRAK